MKKGVMDDGWNAKIKKAVAEAHKATADIKPEKKADPKTKKSAIEAEIDKIIKANSAGTKKTK